jgi:glycosyltransferase involved in cell wall biosynthesis
MLYTWDWSYEFRDYNLGLVPAHRLCGAAELPSLGLPVRTCRWRPVPNVLRRLQVWKIWQALWVFAIQRSVGCVVATTEASALPVLLLRFVRVLRTPVIVLSVATLTDKYLDGAGGWFRRLLLRQATYVVVYATSQVQLTSELLGIEPRRVRFIPFGVDVDFFQPADGSREWDFVSVGSNEGKDFPTLVSSLPVGSRCLIVTSVSNQEAALATPTEGTLVVEPFYVAIHELRTLYASGGYQVIPLRDVLYSSGQTVLLENLAMGRPVIVSDTASTRDYVTPEIATVVPPGDTGAMRRALSSPPPPLVPAATKHVRRHFTSRRFARDLAALCAEVAGTRSGLGSGVSPSGTQVHRAAHLDGHGSIDGAQY